MKKEFIGFYEPTQQEIDEAWNNGHFIFDTNALLNLYRYTDATRTDFIHVLNVIKSKLYLPYQIAFEYHSNRLSVIKSLRNSYERVLQNIQDNFDKYLEAQIKSYSKHPTISVENILNLHKEFYNSVSKELETQKESHPDFIKRDGVLDALTTIFENKTGKEISKEDLKKLFEEGKHRYDQLIPPGFKDLDNKKKKGDRHVYGDYIIWKELINFTKEVKKPLVFITDDRKEDWWTIENGQTIRPKEELIKEFFDLTGIRILIYNADIFLQYAKERELVPELKEETVREVEEVRKGDEISNFEVNQISRIQPVVQEGLSTALNWKRHIEEQRQRELYSAIDWGKNLEEQREFYSGTDLARQIVETQELYSAPNWSQRLARLRELQSGLDWALELARKNELFSKLDAKQRLGGNRLDGQDKLD